MKKNTTKGKKMAKFLIYWMQSSVETHKNKWERIVNKHVLLHSDVLGQRDAKHVAASSD